MATEPENLLESDRIEDVLEDTGTPAPVVVVQNQRRVMPWLLIIGSIVALALGSAFAYREVVRLRMQAELAHRDLQRAYAQSNAEEIERRLKEAPPPPTQPELATGPIAAGPAASNPPPSSAPPPTPEPPASAAAPVAGTEAPAPSAPVAPTEPATPSRPRPRVLARIPGTTEAVPAAAPAPTGPADRPGPIAAGPKSDPRPMLAAVSGATGAFDEVDELGALTPAPADAATATASAEPPLPSREETERRIRAEAAAMQHQDEQRLGQQKEDLQALRGEERRQFIDELRLILKVHQSDRMAGQEIERLSNRSGRNGDPKLMLRARIVIGESRTSQRGKVRKLREIGVPEPVILDYLANTQHQNLGARYGPRSPSEVWVRAARILRDYYDLDERRPAAPRAPAEASPAPASPRRAGS